jgi:Ca-activated chloride channel homolog
LLHSRHSLRFCAVLLLITLVSGSLLLTRAQQKPSAPTPQADDVLRVETDLTNILFTATDNNKRFVTTLQREDLRVLENDTPQEIFTFQRETNLPLSMAILIDTSRSQAQPLPDEQAAARSFVQSVIRPDKDKAAIVSFTGKSKIEQKLTNDVARLIDGIGRVEVKIPPEEKLEGRVATPQDTDVQIEEEPWIYSTAIWDAMSFAVDEVLAQTPENTRRAIILLTDGDDTSSSVKRQEAIERAIKAQVVVYCVGIAAPDSSVEKDTLRKVSTQTGGSAFFPEDQTILPATFKQIEDELRSQYLLAYTPSNSARDGSYRRIRLELINPDLKKQKLRLLYRQGYYARQAVK